MDLDFIYRLCEYTRIYHVQNKPILLIYNEYTFNL